MKQYRTYLNGTSSRRSFLGKGLAAAAGTAGLGLLSSANLTSAAPATGAASQVGSAATYASTTPMDQTTITRGDVAILRFLAALETIEADLWQQYNELAGIQDDEVPGGTGNPTYTTAVAFLDSDMPQYIHDNTDDEYSHAAFLNKYLESIGAEAVDMRHFFQLPSSQATGAVKDAKRLTNLMQLSVDTSWWTRYRSSTGNPDLGDTFPQAFAALAAGRFPAIPRDDSDLTPHDHIQAIGNTAGFHFAFIEQGGSSLYPSLAQRVTDPEVLRILLSIGPTETAHFQTWHDKAGNYAPLTDPKNPALVFPDLNSPPFGGEEFQTNLIMPEPTVFLNRKFPPVSIIRPTATTGAAMGAVKALTDDGLFIGQTPDFFNFLHRLAADADKAERHR